VDAARRPELIGRQHGARRRLDFREVPEREQELTGGLLLRRRELVVGRLVHVDADVPDPLVREAQRTPPVVERVDAEPRHREQDQEGDEDLRDDQEVGPLAVPDEREDVAGHREAPFKASTG
jgi:hypothetical protein